MKTILSITLACLTTVIWAQSSDQNYIKTAVYKQPVTTPAANSGNARIEINYFEAWGVLLKISNTPKHPVAGILSRILNTMLTADKSKTICRLCVKLLRWILRA